MTSQHDPEAEVVDPGWLTVEEVARLAGKTDSYVRRLAREETIEARRDGRRWLIAASVVGQLSRSGRGTAEIDEDRTWDLERRLLYAERAELQLRLQEERASRLEAENASLRADNERLRAALVALVHGAPSSTTS